MFTFGPDSYFMDSILIYKGTLPILFIHSPLPLIRLTIHECNPAEAMLFIIYKAPYIKFVDIIV